MTGDDGTPRKRGCSQDMRAARSGKTRIKICCIESIDEARRAIGAGATAVGLVSEMPSGPGVIDERQIEIITRGVKLLDPAIDTFLLTSSRDPSSIAAQQRRTGTHTIQLVDSIVERGHEDLRALLPGVNLVQVIHVTGPEAIEEARELAPFVDAILLDSGRPVVGPDNPVRELGGTGRIHDWSISRAIREAVDLPVYLAGGLDPENVGRAVVEVGPSGVDVCSGVRTGGALDEAKAAAFVRAVRRAERVGEGERE